ncbi:bifunctional 23S rRNA (guanine(2069)-N(7))-methyltransferase RlmK/23S rRNA (guanine(2445)-N(2))-methyltransferase RlmL [Agaribacter marinus]|uniref:Ribosomal RNA large subunit methyltransferase K/L n=1 Tax=Agaribacter marinus TaxID=1431249 RepID=A0AA37WGH1_9ALTE|nr:bifunctional 23S rRNA (guanine(2069)-N(7))-methyltransferase RlmK/23S rRNA (guanine(2445)-N(2))-methyltransferase RlmL [Agaribacter marinus]GLR70126.1 ribosomal RNA large subunit methyltransferase K/L [Agaribacter marinus]
MPDIIVTTSTGIEELLKIEIADLCDETDLDSIRVKPGQCRFSADLRAAYTLCLHSRLANRVLVVLASGRADDAEKLYSLASSVKWPDVFASDTPFLITARGANRELRNTQFIAQKVKDAVVDSFQEQQLPRPNVDKSNAYIKFQVRVFREHADICVDFSGNSLHMRGYRLDTGDAPLKEHVAVAMLKRSGWQPNGDTPLLDPMCGSGTIAIEAAMMAANIPPNMHRDMWGFDFYLGHKLRTWQAIEAKAEAQISKPKMPIFGSDVSMIVVEKAIENATRANVIDYIEFKQVDALQLRPPTESGQIVSNPPYGERLGEFASMLPLYDELGEHFKTHFANWQLALLCSEQSLLKALKLRAHKRYQLFNGKLECQLALYEMTEGNLEMFSVVDENSELANRLKKNIKKLSKWINKGHTDAYRVYDADLPNYNFAIDRYGDWVILQEYQAPKSIPEKVANERLQHAILHVPKALGIDPKKLVVKTRKKQAGKNQYEKNKTKPSREVSTRHKRFTVHEYGAKFWINPKDYLDVGLFLDHRETRQMFAAQCAGADVLNLFCYTGSVSVHAALSGARSVTSVDMSNTYLQWAKDNFVLNGIKGANVFEQANCIEWVAQAQQRKQCRYDRIFLDPPSFSNSKRMQDTWDVQRDHIALIESVKAILKPNGKIFFSNNLRSFQLDETAIVASGFTIQNITKQSIPEDFSRNQKIHHCWVLSL